MEEITQVDKVQEILQKFPYLITYINTYEARIYRFMDRSKDIYTYCGGEQEEVEKLLQLLNYYISRNLGK